MNVQIQPVQLGLHRVMIESVSKITHEWLWVVMGIQGL
jgi:hypothetical protein